MNYAKTILLVATLNMGMVSHAISDTDNCFPSELKVGDAINASGLEATVLEIDGCWVKLQAEGRDSAWFHAVSLGRYRPI